MSNAKLVAITVERFKSFEHSTRVELAPLTIILGRNNSGKSTLIQSLLLLKQTLRDVNPEVMLRLEGTLDAFNLRELTFGWPGADAPRPGFEDESARTRGPTIAVEWECEVDVKGALSQLRGADLGNVAKHSGVEWLASPPDRQVLRTAMTIETMDFDGTARVSSVTLTSGQTVVKVVVGPEPPNILFWNGDPALDIDVELDHFIPRVHIDRTSMGKRDRQRAWHNAYLVVFAPALQSLKELLTEMHYLGSTRQPPPSLFKAATTAPNELGVSGELAAQLLHRRQKDIVHFLPPPTLPGALTRQDQVLARPFVQAVNAVMEALSVDTARTPVRLEDVQEVGFRIMFGNASLVHVGRGLGYLIPLVELGLFADPLKFTGPARDTTLAEYQAACRSITHIALEEPEAHLHPKVASRLAHWLVSLARSNRRMLVETHSDHLVRRLRGLVARAGRGSELEAWLLANVVVLSVEQDASGRSSVTTSRLTAEGGVGEVWPADFMDEATDEESAIYYAKLDKADPQAPIAHPVEMVDGEEPESDEAP